VITLKLDKHYLSGVRVDTDGFRMGAKSTGVRARRSIPKKTPDMFGDRRPMPPVVRPAVPAPELLQVAKRCRELHLGLEPVVPVAARNRPMRSSTGSPCSRATVCAPTRNIPWLNALNVDSTFTGPRVELLTQTGCECRRISGSSSRPTRV